MGKNTVLTKPQRIVLDQISKSQYIIDNFYFTGGTVLSEFYLHHRFSDDLDFFTEKQYLQQEIMNLISTICAQYKWEYTAEIIESLYIFYIHIDNKNILKVDFSHYPHQRIEKGILYNQLQVDSLMDIAINKLTTIQQRSQIKDFVDCYYLFEKFSIWDLIEGATIKFGLKIDPWVLSADLLNIDSFELMPKMIKPLTLEKLQHYFHSLAKKMGQRGVEM